MSTKIINYINNNHQLFDDFLVKQSDLDDHRFPYTKCPAFGHKRDRVFVGISPIDFEFNIDRSQKIISCTDSNLVDDLHQDFLNSPQPVIQFKFPRFTFWTQDDNVWLEMNDHPMTSLDNNLIMVPGWFNLSNWSRNCSMAFTIVDELKPVLIKKGDPLFRISFHSSNPDDNIVLKKETNTEVINQWVEVGAHSKLTEQDWKPRLFSKTKTETRGPFSFLFK